jgi:alpha-tubulin suppressor-like RCC1 family protein
MGARCSGIEKTMARAFLLSAVTLVAIALVPAGIAAGAPSSGHAWAWGDNADGQLGNGTITRYGGLATPGQVRTRSV